MSKAPRWSDTLVNTKGNRTTQKKEGKEPAALTVPVSSGSKPAGSSKSKTSISYGRSNSLSSRGTDSTAADSKVGGSLKRGSLSRQAKGRPSHPNRPAHRLSSSRSFSSLNTTCLTAAPFMRSSRSLNRLDQRSTGDDLNNAVVTSQVGKGQAAGKKFSDSGRLSSSEEHLRDGVYTLSGMRRNWVQVVLKNARPSPPHNVTSSLSDQRTEQLQEHRGVDWTEDSHQQQQEQETKLETDGKSSSSLLSVSSSASSAPSPTNPLKQEEEGQGVTIESCVEGSQSDSCPSTAVLSNDECFDEHSNTQSAIQQIWQQVETAPQRQDRQVPINGGCDCSKDKETLPCEQQTGQLLKELQEIQRELSQLQQLNRNLQDELRQERESRSRERLFTKNGTSSSSEQTAAFQQLQKINHDLRFELEAQKRSQEEAREAELRRRVDLLAQQAQLLVTGDATALAQAHLEQDRRCFQEQQVEWEQGLASLKSQLNISEEQRRETESRLTQLQQELQSLHSLQQEAEQLRKQVQEVTTQLQSYEDAQAQKEARLQNHLMLLQASQERERRSLTASLAQAERHSQDLQERLDGAELQVESFNKSQTLTREIEEAQQQLQEEMTCTVSAVQQLQEEREQLDHRCTELQNQLSEADKEASRLQDRLRTEETHFYNLEHSYERVCEELQVASGKVQQREAEMQDIREGYENLLDRKEQELSEVLLKMEVLGNSLEETEVKLNEVLKVCTCASSQLKDEGQETNESSPKEMDRCQMSNSSNAEDVIQVYSNGSHEHGRTRSRSIDASYQYIVTAGDNPERFLSVIQLLERKLYVTEEKLKDITQRLEEHQTHISCQDPHLCSQLTQSRATTQHLSLLLHSQAKQSQRFALETENRCRMLVGRFQVALNIVQASRERLQATPIDIQDFEKQLATVVACLQQGEKDAEKQKHESYNASKGEDKILNNEKLAGAESETCAESKITNTQSSEDDVGSVWKCLMREQFVVEKMVSVLQGQNDIYQLSLSSRKDEGDVAHRYKNIISQRITLKTEERTQSGRTGCDEPLESAIGRACAEAELVYASLKFQQQHESVIQVNNEEVDHQRTGLADINPPELAPYEERDGGRGLEEITDQTDDKKAEAEKEPDWLDRLVSRLQRRAKFLHQLCQETSDDSSQTSECSTDHKKASAVDLNYLQEQAKLIYLSDRLYLDLESQQSEALQNKLQAQEKDINFTDEQEAFNHTLCQLQKDNSTLREELEQAEKKLSSVGTGNKRLLEDIQKIEDFHDARMQKLETGFQEKIIELQQIHEEEMKHLHGYYTKSYVSKDRQTKSCAAAPPFTEGTFSLLDQTVTERQEGFGGDAQTMRETHQKDLGKLQASCDRGLSAMEKLHRKLIEDLREQHQEEVSDLLKEKEQLLQEETAATVAAIVAMRRAHKQELDKSRQSQRIRENADITQLHNEYEKQIQLLDKELEVLSVQHTEKCLENSQLSQELQDERKSMMQYQKENQQLKKKQVILRAREAEMQFLRQEARSLREELKIARMDKIYAQNKLQALYKNNQQ
ncbi:early endosome antigen 1, partial [Brachyistius frenatus]|uniref:early endosome antigen 1 n=1 Tax=Brachyistius frenatus TaxID=100188 RepID=UPI0037E75BDE